MSSTGDPSIEVFSPEGRRAAAETGNVAHLAALEQARIAFLSDFRFEAETIFACLGEELASSHPGIELVGPNAFGNIHSHGSKQLLEELPAELAARGCDAVIAGIGA